MRQTTGIYCAVVFSLTITLTNWAEAAPRRGARRSNSSSYVSYSSGGLKAIAPKADGDSEKLRVLKAYYSYDKALLEEFAFADRIRVFLLVDNEEFTRVAEPIVAEVKLTELSNGQVSHLRHCPVSFEETTNPQYRLAVFDIANLPDEPAVIRPAKVYRLFVNLHQKSESLRPATALGRVPLPYYVATSGEDRLDRARQHIAMRTFKEFYYAQQGWRSEASYPMDCYAYYMWATGSCTVDAQNGLTLLHRLFGGRRPFQSGADIVSIARKEAIHGDYVRIPGHSFMLLAHDAQAGHVWTMEGNFNSTIEIVRRSVDAGWTIGHLVEEHVHPGMFQVSQATRGDEASRSRL